MLLKHPVVEKKKMLHCALSWCVVPFCLQHFVAVSLECCSCQASSVGCVLPVPSAGNPNDCHWPMCDPFVVLQTWNNLGELRYQAQPDAAALRYNTMSLLCMTITKHFVWKKGSKMSFLCLRDVQNFSNWLSKISVTPPRGHLLVMHSSLICLAFHSMLFYITEHILTVIAS